MRYARDRRQLISGGEMRQAELYAYKVARGDLLLLL